MKNDNRRNEIEEALQEQMTSSRPIGEDEKLPLEVRHRFSSMTLRFEKPPYDPFIAMTLPDNACPSFISASQECFGTKSDILDYCKRADEDTLEYINYYNSIYKTEEEISRAKANGRYIEPEAHMTETFLQAMTGEQKTLFCFGCEKLIPDAESIVHARAHVLETNMKYMHYNIWDWVYNFSADSCDTEIAWISYIPDRHICRDLPFNEEDEARYRNAMVNSRLSSDPKPDRLYVRAIRCKMTHPNAVYREDPIYEISGYRAYNDVDGFAMRLFVVDETFADEHEMQKDIAMFSPTNLNLSSIYDQMLIDG